MPSLPVSVTINPLVTINPFVCEGNGIGPIDVPVHESSETSPSPSLSLLGLSLYFSLFGAPQDHRVAVSTGPSKAVSSHECRLRSPQMSRVGGLEKA